MPVIRNSSAGAPSLRGTTIEELRTELQFYLQHLANRLDEQNGSRGVPTFQSPPDFQGNRLTNIAVPTSATDAQQAGNSLGLNTKATAYDAQGYGITNLPLASANGEAVPYEQLTSATANLAAGDASYVTVSTEPRLSKERRLAAEASVLTLTDAGANGTLTVSVATNGITDAKLRQGAAVSVIGRSVNSTGNVADIASGANGNVLRRAANVVGFGQITLNDATNTVTGTLAIGNGGTNSATALNNNRIAVTSAGAIVEAAALTNGQLLIGSTGAAPVAAAVTAGSGITLTPGAGSLTIATTLTLAAGVYTP